VLGRPPFPTFTDTDLADPGHSLLAAVGCFLNPGPGPATSAYQGYAES